MYYVNVQWIHVYWIGIHGSWYIHQYPRIICGYRLDMDVKFYIHGSPANRSHFQLMIDTGQLYSIEYVMVWRHVLWSPSLSRTRPWDPRAAGARETLRLSPLSEFHKVMYCRAIIRVENTCTTLWKIYSAQYVRNRPRFIEDITKLFWFTFCEPQCISEVGS